ncbi:MAG: hypothetical protein ACI9P8_002152 [Bacteroidia bacterium]|jgi:hypothetical protein
MKVACGNKSSQGNGKENRRDNRYAQKAIGSNCFNNQLVFPSEYFFRFWYFATIEFCGNFEEEKCNGITQIEKQHHSENAAKDSNYKGLEVIEANVQ